MTESANRSFKVGVNEKRGPENRPIYKFDSGYA